MLAGHLNRPGRRAAGNGRPGARSRPRGVRRVPGRGQDAYPHPVWPPVRVRAVQRAACAGPLPCMPHCSDDGGAGLQVTQDTCVRVMKYFLCVRLHWIGILRGCGESWRNKWQNRKCEKLQQHFFFILFLKIYLPRSASRRAQGARHPACASMFKDQLQFDLLCSVETVECSDRPPPRLSARVATADGDAPHPVSTV